MFRSGLSRIEKYAANAVSKNIVLSRQPQCQGGLHLQSQNVNNRTSSCSSSSSLFFLKTPAAANLYCKRDYCTPITERGVPTHSPTPFEKNVLVYSKTFAKIEDVPERVTRSQMKAAKDKFRVVVAVWFMVVWAISTAIIIAWGKSTRSQHMKEEAARSRQQYIEEKQREQEQSK